MKNFEDITPESQTGGLREKEESKSLGLERVGDIEKARVMAVNENLFRSQEKAYEHYLKHPEAHTAEERLQFSLWKENKVGPADVLEFGERTAEIIGSVFDKEVRISRLEKEKNRSELVREATVSGIKAFSRILVIDFWHIPRAYWEIMFKKRGYISIFGTKESTAAYQKLFGDLAGFLTAVDALWKINKEGKEGVKLFSDDYAEDLLKRAEAYEIPDLLHKTESKAGQESENKNEPSAREGVYTEIQGEEEKTENRTKEDINPAAKATMHIFDWIAEKYRDYLNLPEGKVNNPLFKKLKDAGVLPKDIKEEGVDTGKWISGLTEWEIRLNSFDKEQLKSEHLLNFYDLLIRFFDKKKITKIKRSRDLLTPILKMFRSSVKLGRLGSK